MNRARKIKAPQESVKKKAKPEPKPSQPPAPKNTDPTKPPKFGKIADGNRVDFNAEGLSAAGLEQMFARTFGTANGDVHPPLLTQLAATVEFVEQTGLAAACNYAVALLHGIGPQDPLEGLLGVQMIGTHNLAMKFLRLAAVQNQTFEGHDANVNRAAKLLRVFAAQVEALTKYRGKGQQKVEVKHVHVHEGGQAIVGNVSQGGGGCSCGNGRTTPYAEAEPSEEQQPSGRLSESEAMRREDQERQALPRPRDEERTLPLARRSQPGSAERQPECLEARATVG